MSAVQQDVIHVLLPDKAEIIKALDALFDPADVIELRAFHKGRKRTDAGYFDTEHRDKLVAEAVRLSNAGAAVYVTLNRLDPQLLGHYANRIEQFAQATTTDANVTRRRWLLLDFDPKKPKDTSATDEQLKAAKDCARKCLQALRAEAWPKPLIAESGNGIHLLYRLDLPNDSESDALIEGALAGLAQRFDTERVKLYKSAHNAGRIIKLYGTVAIKGDHTPIAPWRLSKLVSVPVRGQVVMADQLRALHSPAEPQPINGTPPHHSGSFNLEEFLSRLGIAYTQDIHSGSERYKLDHCPFNPEHGKGEAAIFRGAGGKLGFRCQHNSCADKHSQDVRELVDGLARDGAYTSTHNAPADKARLDFTCLSDLLAEPDEETPWLVDGLLPQAGLSIIVARPKAGKSTLARTLALCVASGESFLGRESVQGSVFYLALEEKRAELRRQFKAMGATDEPIYIYCATAPADGVALLSEAVVRESPALVIIDPIIRLSRMVDSNDYAKVSLALEPFIVMARESGAHVCLIHHSGRGDPQGVDAPMGSTAFAGSVDTILDMKRRERMRTLSSRQRYGDDLEEVVLAMDKTGRITAAGSRADLDRAEAKKQLMEFLTEHSNRDQQAIRDAIEGRWAPIRDALTELIEEKIVTRSGTGKRGDPYLYSLKGDTARSESESEQKVSMNGGPSIYRDQKNQKPKQDSSYCSSESYSVPENTVKNGKTGHSRDHLFDGLGPEKTGIKEPEFEPSQDGESGRQAEPEFDKVVI